MFTSPISKSTKVTKISFILHFAISGLLAVTLPLIGTIKIVAQYRGSSEGKNADKSRKYDFQIVVTEDGRIEPGLRFNLERISPGCLLEITKGNLLNITYQFKSHSHVEPFVPDKHPSWKRTAVNSSSAASAPSLHTRLDAGHSRYLKPVLHIND